MIPEHYLKKKKKIALRKEGRSLFDTPNYEGYWEGGGGGGGGGKKFRKTPPIHDFWSKLRSWIKYLHIIVLDLYQIKKYIYNICVCLCVPLSHILLVYVYEEAWMEPTFFSLPLLFLTCHVLSWTRLEVFLLSHAYFLV